MPQNPFLKFQQYETKPPRNTVDMSHRVNASFAFGYLNPVLCLEVNPGETFSIESAFGLKFFPMPFPVQTPMHATMHIYYVRNRTIWPDFVDFIYNNKSADQVPHPYISRPASDKEFWKTGGIADRLGVPTEVFLDGSTNSVSVPLIGLSRSSNEFLSSGESSVDFNANMTTTSNYSTYRTQFRPFGIALPGEGNMYLLRYMIRYSPIFSTEHQDDAFASFGFMAGPIISPLVPDDGKMLFTFPCSLNQPTASDVPVVCLPFVKSSQDDDLLNAHLMIPPEDWPVYGESSSWMGAYSHSNGASYFTLEFSDGEAFSVLSSQLEEGHELYLYFGVPTKSEVKNFMIMDPSDILKPSNPQPGVSCCFNIVSSESSGIADYPSANPFAAVDVEHMPALPLSALPFRAYEAIYNAYYRNERLEPLMIDGQPEYNKYSPSMNSGADTFPYRLYKRNWEADFLTTCLPSPQQGIAPVVGVVGLSNIQIQDPDSEAIYNFTAEVDQEDGETVVGGSFHNPDAPLAVRRTAQDIITAGFTINDFRNVSALQRWAENNLRRGLKYRDQVLANTGVKPRYDELDMPEFIGGFSRPVQVTSVTQTSPGGDAGLGDYAGQANCFGQSKHRISHYCDEAGFIIGILCVTPTPVYSQLLPKHFLKRTPLDYHHVVFNHIGMQPVTYDEVCPLQVYQANPGQTSEGVKFNDVFGYQRPYYDLLQHVDTVHGAMRNTMRNYLMNRTFGSVPQLGGDFIHVDPKQLNQVFNVQDGDDVIMGEIYFRIYAKRPVSLFGQPKIV